MRYAILSDIHGNLAALQAVVKAVERLKVDQIVNLGDSLSGPLWHCETADFLIQQRNWIHISGNHERQLLSTSLKHMGASDAYAAHHLKPEHWRWLRQLPQTHRAADVMFCHGTPDSDVAYFLEHIELSGQVRPARIEEIIMRLNGETSPLIACGHTHVSRVVRINNRTNLQTIVNPGSVGLPAYTDAHPVPHCIETGDAYARFATAEKKGNEWQIALHSVPYDFELAALLAEKNARPDWAKALRTGYV